MSEGSDVITDTHGNLLKASTEALVNTVNTVGVMGKGIALQFKRAYPAMFSAYKRACDAGEVRLGHMWVWETGALTGPQLIINFPTKQHWKSKSRIGDVVSGLDDLVRVINERNITSIAVPPLGCGNGGLDWGVVRPEIERALSAVPSVDVQLYAPEGAPAARDMATNTARPAMSEGKAALVTILDRYAQRAVEVSLIEIQKLMYFLQEAGQPLNLDYRKARYGPYADNLRQVLVRVEGHFLTGYGDGSRTVKANEPLQVLPGAVKEATEVVAHDPSLASRIERVLQLVDGFESTYSMELLATVHWVSVKEGADAAPDSAAAGELVRAWSARKQGLFEQPHIDIAWRRLSEQGWLAAA